MSRTFYYRRRKNESSVRAGSRDSPSCPRNLPALPPPQEIPLRSNVYEVYATDQDEGLNGAVRYSFLKSTGNRDWEYFTIDPISGLIQTAQRLDREKQAVYSVRGRGPAQGAWLREGLSSGCRATTSSPRMTQECPAGALCLLL